MSSQLAAKVLKEMLDGPMVNWSQQIATLDTKEMCNIEDQAWDAIVRMARIATYVEFRAGGYTHTRAVKEQNKMATKVRRVIGFSYPKDDITF